MTLKKDPYCLYCGSSEHGNADCTIGKQIMTQLYGGGLKPIGEDKPALYGGPLPNVAYTEMELLMMGRLNSAANAIHTAMHNALVYGTGFIKDGVSIHPEDVYLTKPDNSALIEALEQARFTALDEDQITDEQSVLILTHIETLK